MGEKYLIDFTKDPSVPKVSVKISRRLNFSS